MRKADITVVRGDTWGDDLACYDQKRSPLDLTGAVVTFTMWEEGFPPFFTVGGTPLPASGSIAYPWVVAIEIPAATTETLDPARRYEYAARFEKGSREMYLVTGRVFVGVVS